MLSGDNTEIREEIGTGAKAWLSANTEHLAESLAQSKCEVNTVDPTLCPPLSLTRRDTHSSKKAVISRLLLRLFLGIHCAMNSFGLFWPLKPKLVPLWI